MKKLRPRLTFANVVSCLALFVALGGGAYAAARLAKNSVGAKQLKKEAVTPVKLSKSSKAALAGAPGPKGEPGTPGSPGAPGAALGYAFILEGKLVAAQSKGVVGIAEGVDQAGTGTSPLFTCFQLEIKPTNISVTPMVGFNSGGEHAAVNPTGVVPGYPPFPGKIGCPVGFRDAEVFAADPSEDVPHGFYVLFN